MKFDYSERRLESKNKPRRQPVGMYAAGILTVTLLVFASGFAGGWLTCWYKMKKTTPTQQAGLLTAAPAPKTGQTQLVPAVPGAQPAPLTFYETLPKGEKGVIGSGINANLQDHSSTPATKPPVQPQPVQVHSKPSQAAVPTSKPVEQSTHEKPAAVKPAPAATSAVKASRPADQNTPEKPAASKPVSSPPSATKTPAPVKSEKPTTVKTDGERKYTVQVASVKDKSEADSLRNKLAAKGMNPMVIEVDIPEKGVVYRVRAGRHLLQSEAQELAAKLGSGAMAITE